MQRPKDPSKHGLVKPEKTISKLESILIPFGSDLRFSSYRAVSLKEVNTLWDKIVKEQFSDKDIKIVHGPFIVGYHLEFVWEQTNENYDVEMSCYSVAMNEYAEELRQYELKLKAKNQQDIDEKIVHAEQRLANLKAAKNNQPLPYPEKYKNPVR